MSQFWQTFRVITKDEHIRYRIITKHRIVKINVWIHWYKPLSIKINDRHGYITKKNYTDQLWWNSFLSFIIKISQYFLDICRMKSLRINRNYQRFCSRCVCRDIGIRIPIQISFHCTINCIIYEDGNKINFWRRSGCFNRTSETDKLGIMTKSRKQKNY